MIKNTTPHALVFDEKIAAEKLGVNPRTLRRWRKAGVLPFIRMGILVRYNDECLETFLRQNTRNSGTDHADEIDRFVVRLRKRKAS